MFQTSFPSHQNHMNILVIEDNPSIRKMIQIFLEREKFTLDQAAEGLSGFEKARSKKYDLILLDLNLPGKSGFEIITSLRSLKIQIPILVISARTSLEDKLMALNLGADDYLVKDFALYEMLARVKSLIRRSTGHGRNIFKCGGLVLNIAEMTVTREGQKIKLPKKDFTLLATLIRQKNKTVETPELLKALWGDQNITSTNALNVHMRTLRKMVDEGFETKLLHTVRGFGYKLSDRKG